MAITQTKVFDEYNLQTDKKNGYKWTFKTTSNDITATGSDYNDTFTFVTPSMYAKFAGSSNTTAVYTQTYISIPFSINFELDSEGETSYPVNASSFHDDDNYPAEIWLWRDISDAKEKARNYLKQTNNTYYTVYKRNDYSFHGDYVAPHSFNVLIRNIFNAENKTNNAVTVTANLDINGERNTKSNGEGSYYGTGNVSWTPILATVTLDAPPTFTIGNITKDTPDYYAGYTTITVPVSSISAKYSGYITKIELIVGSQISSKDFTDTSRPSSTTNMTMLLNSSGTFTPQIRVTDSRGQTTTTPLSSEIVVKGYTSPSVLFSLARTSSNGKISDEGTSAVITANFTYENIMAKLSQPTVKIDGTTKTTTWYTTWNGNASSNNLSGAVNWTNYNPSSPVTLYGFVSGTFNTNNSYIIGVTPSDTIAPGVETTQTLAPAFYTIDFQAGGKEIAFGAPANDDNIPSNGLFKCAMDFILKGENVLTDSIKYIRTSTGDLNWGTGTTSGMVITKGALTYWNGAYNGTSSNLKYSSNGEILGKTNVKDYIVETDSSGIWKWNKYASGKIECWGEKSWSSVACTTSAGGGYRSADVTQALPSSLFTTIESCQATMKGSSGSGYTMILRTLCDNTTVTQMFWNTSSATKTTLTVDYYIIGS